MVEAWRVNYENNQKKWFEKQWQQLKNWVMGIGANLTSFLSRQDLQKILGLDAESLYSYTKPDTNKLEHLVTVKKELTAPLEAQMTAIEARNNQNNQPSIDPLVAQDAKLKAVEERQKSNTEYWKKARSSILGTAIYLLNSWAPVGAIATSVNQVNPLSFKNDAKIEQIANVLNQTGAVGKQNIVIGNRTVEINLDQVPGVGDLNNLENQINTQLASDTTPTFLDNLSSQINRALNQTQVIIGDAILPTANAAEPKPEQMSQSSSESQNQAYPNTQNTDLGSNKELEIENLAPITQQAIENNQVTALQIEQGIKKNEELLQRLRQKGLERTTQEIRSILTKTNEELTNTQPATTPTQSELESNSSAVSTFPPQNNSKPTLEQIKGNNGHVAQENGILNTAALNNGDLRTTRNGAESLIIPINNISQRPNIGGDQEIVERIGQLIRTLKPEQQTQANDLVQKLTNENKTYPEILQTLIRTYGNSNPLNITLDQRVRDTFAFSAIGRPSTLQPSPNMEAGVFTPKRETYISGDVEIKDGVIKINNLYSGYFPENWQFFYPNTERNSVVYKESGIEAYVRQEGATTRQTGTLFRFNQFNMLAVQAVLPTGQQLADIPRSDIKTMEAVLVEVTGNPNAIITINGLPSFSGKTSIINVDAGSTDSSKGGATEFNNLLFPPVVAQAFPTNDLRGATFVPGTKLSQEWLDKINFDPSTGKIAPEYSSRPGITPVSGPESTLTTELRQIISHNSIFGQQYIDRFLGNGSMNVSLGPSPVQTAVVLNGDLRVQNDIFIGIGNPKLTGEIRFSKNGDYSASNNSILTNPQFGVLTNLQTGAVDGNGTLLMNVMGLVGLALRPLQDSIFDPIIAETQEQYNQNTTNSIPSTGFGQSPEANKARADILARSEFTNSVANRTGLEKYVFRAQLASNITPENSSALQVRIGMGDFTAFGATLNQTGDTRLGDYYMGYVNVPDPTGGKPGFMGTLRGLVTVTTNDDKTYVQNFGAIPGSLPTGSSLIKFANWSIYRIDETPVEQQIYQGNLPVAEAQLVYPFTSGNISGSVALGYQYNPFPGTVPGMNKPQISNTNWSSRVVLKTDLRIPLDNYWTLGFNGNMSSRADQLNPNTLTVSAAYNDAVPNSTWEWTGTRAILGVQGQFYNDFITEKPVSKINPFGSVIQRTKEGLFWQLDAQGGVGIAGEVTLPFRANDNTWRGGIYAGSYSKDKLDQVSSEFAGGAIIQYNPDKNTSIELKAGSDGVRIQGGFRF